MAPIGAAGYVFVAALLVTAALVGILVGTIAWALRIRFLWGGLAAVVGFLVQTTLLGPYRFEPAAAHGLPLVMLTFSTSWLTGRFLEVRARWRHGWATLAAFGCAVLVGMLGLSVVGRYLGFPTR